MTINGGDFALIQRDQSAFGGVTGVDPNIQFTFNARPNRRSNFYFTVDSSS
jgi:hypothetical protein